LGTAADTIVWAYAAEYGFAIVSKDADFHTLSYLRGHPPKVVWVRRGNCSTAAVAGLLRQHHAVLRTIEHDPVTALLAIS
jgi:predicted nuclease of predicted toxin-antitoxin system